MNKDDQNKPSGMMKYSSLVMAIILFACVIAFIAIKTDENGAFNPSSANANADAGAYAESRVRIAALLPFAADQLLRLGVTPVCVPGLRGNTPSGWEGIETVQMDHSAGPNLEQLIASDPDYIISGSTYAQFLPQIEEATGAEVVYMDVDSIDSVFQYIKQLGKIADRDMQAQILIDELKQNIDVANASTQHKEISVLALFGTPHSFYVFMPSTYLGDIVFRSGGTLGPSGLQSHSVYKGLSPVSMESVLEYDPDLLLILFHGPVETSRAMFESDPLWGSLRAIREDRVHYLSDDLYAMRPGSNIAEAITEIQDAIASAIYIHP